MPSIGFGETEENLCVLNCSWCYHHCWSGVRVDTGIVPCYSTVHNHYSAHLEIENKRFVSKSFVCNDLERSRSWFCGFSFFQIKKKIFIKISKTAICNDMTMTNYLAPDKHTNNKNIYITE